MTIDGQAVALRCALPQGGPRLCHGRDRLHHEQVDARISEQARACSVNADSMAARSSLVFGFSPSGPIAPATSAWCACFSRMPSTAARARRTPAVLISATFPSRPKRFRRTALRRRCWFRSVPRRPAGTLRAARGQAVRIGQVQLVKAAIDEDAAGVKHGAHGAVAQRGRGAEQAFERRGLRRWKQEVGMSGGCCSIVLCREGGRTELPCSRRGLLWYTSTGLRKGQCRAHS